MPGVIVAAFVLAAIAQLPAKDDKVEIKGPLAGLPSKPGPHVEKIKALDDDSWLELGAPAADPKWGKARGRAWGCRMPFAPELGGAFLFGEGVHGYTKPDGHYMDDLWFYDLNAHRWICCYPGADVKSLDLTVTEEGFEATKDGERIPVASMAHAYEMVTYDTKLKRFMSMPCPGDYWKKPLERRLQWLKDVPKDAPKAAGPWTFDTTASKWDRRTSSTPQPHSGFGDVFIYLPDRERAFFRNKDGVWSYDPAKNKWASLAPKGPKAPFGIDPTACYDTKRQRVYLGGGSYPVAPKGENAFWVYDVKENAWIDPKPKGAPCNGSTSYNTNVAAMHYDTVNDVVVLFHFGGDKEGQGIFIYDPESNTWLAEPRVACKATGQCKNAYYDPELNVHIIHGAGDSRDDGTVWAYRYKKVKK
jgi:hypothetical protein